MTIAPRTLIILGLAIGAATLTGVATHQWLTAQNALRAAQAVPQPVAEPQIVMAEVLVAARDVPIGWFIKPDDLVWRSWPRDALGPDYIEKTTGSMDAFAGSVARTKLYASEPVTLARVVHPGEQGFLAAVLEPEMRAVSVPVDLSSGIAGFVFPGDRVDVLLSYRITEGEAAGGAGKTRHFSRTLLGGVRVLAVDQSVDNATGEAHPAQTVTLEVTQKQAEKLALSLDFGTLSLSLRSLIPETPAAVVADGDATPQVTSSAETTASFTRDIDVMYVSSEVSSEPETEPVPDQVRQIFVLRGKESEAVAF